MGNKINEGKKFNKKEFNLKFIGEIKKGDNSYLIKLIKDTKKYFNFKIKSEKTKDIIIFNCNNEKLKLNLIDTNIGNNNYIVDCIIMEYNINDIKSFEDIKIVWNEKLKENKEANLFYLIGIKIDSEEKTKNEAINFSLKNNLKYFSISHKNENDIKVFIKDLLQNLKKNCEINNNKDSKCIKGKYKVCFLGSCGAGAKTCLINAIIGKDFDRNTNSTLSPSYVIKTVKLDNNREIELELWDTVGQVKLKALTKLFLTNVDCFVFGFDVTSNISFDEIKEWYEIAKENTNVNLMYLIANKIDLLNSRVIWENDAKNLAKKYNFRYFEISCATGIGIQEFVNDLANEIIKY